VWVSSQQINCYWEESNHIIEIKLLALGFLQIFGSHFQFPGKDNCLFCPTTLLQEDYGRKVHWPGQFPPSALKIHDFKTNTGVVWHRGLDAGFSVIIRRFPHCKTTFLSLLGYGLWAHKLKSVKSTFKNWILIKNWPPTRTCRPGPWQPLTAPLLVTDHSKQNTFITDLFVTGLLWTWCVVNMRLAWTSLLGTGLL